MHPRIVRALDDALSRAGRQRKRHGLQPAYRAVTRGIDAVERQAPVVERVEHGRQLPGVVEMTHERGAHALDRYQYDVAPYLGPLAADGMQVVARAAVHTVYELLGLGFGLGDVELFVVEFVLDERVVELVESVGLQFVHVDVVAVLEPGIEMQQPNRQ